MTGGSVVDHKIFSDCVYIKVASGEGYTNAIFVERSLDSESVRIDDYVSWRGERGKSATLMNCGPIIKLKRIGCDGVDYPHDRPVVKPKYI